MNTFCGRNFGVICYILQHLLLTCFQDARLPFTHRMLVITRCSFVQSKGNEKEDSSSGFDQDSQTAGISGKVTGTNHMMFIEMVVGQTCWDFYFHFVFLHVPSVLPALCVCVFRAFATIYFPNSTAGLMEIKQNKRKKNVLQVKSKLCKTQQRQHL